MTKAGLWLNATIATLGIVAFTVAAVVMGYKWLATDEADRAYACGSGSRGGLCTSGETTNMVLTLVFGALAVSLVLLLIWGVRSERRKARQSHSQIMTFGIGDD
jgi:NADH:ubiquinone oxidoreductase subunit 3 (subunit A)